MENDNYISAEQKQYLKENKGLLFEYYVQVSNPKYDNKILGDIQIWVYGNDRTDFTPHCHVMLKDRSISFEVSLITWEVINVKSPKGVNASWGELKYFVKPFFKWLRSDSAKLKIPNKILLYNQWDSTNPDNRLEDYIAKHNIEITDSTLFNYIS